MSDETQTADITVERDDSMTNYGMEPIQASIVNPHGKLPEGAFGDVTDKVQDAYDESDLADGEKRTVGEIEYEPRKDGDIVNIQIN